MISRNRSRKVHHTGEETTRWTSVRLAKARANKAKASVARAKGKGSKDRDSKDKGNSKDKGKNKDSIECWNCGKRYSKDCWSKKDNKGGSKGKHKAKNATDAHNLDSTKPAKDEPEIANGGLDMNYFDADAVEMQELHWTKIGVDTGAGETAWPQSVTHGKTIPGDSDLSFRTATGQLVKSGKRLCVEDCDGWGINLRVRGVQALVCKSLLSVGEYTSMGGVSILYGDNCYLFHKGSNVAKKVDACGSKRI